MLADTMSLQPVVLPASTPRPLSGRREETEPEPLAGSIAIPTLWWALLIYGGARALIE